MSVRILSGMADGSSAACLYCSTTGAAFGPLFQSYKEAQLFLHFLGSDPRLLSDGELSAKASAFWAAYRCRQCDALRLVDECVGCKNDIPLIPGQFPAYHQEADQDADTHFEYECANDAAPTPDSEFVCNDCRKKALGIK